MTASSPKPDARAEALPRPWREGDDWLGADTSGMRPRDFSLTLEDGTVLDHEAMGGKDSGFETTCRAGIQSWIDRGGDPALVGRAPALEEGMTYAFHWNEALHPRDNFGKFTKVLATLHPKGQGLLHTVTLGDATRVTRDKDGTFRVVRSGGVTRGFISVGDVARAATDASARGGKATDIGGQTKYGGGFDSYLADQGIDPHAQDTYLPHMPDGPGGAMYFKEGTVHKGTPAELNAVRAGIDERIQLDKAIVADATAAPPDVTEAKKRLVVLERRHLDYAKKLATAAHIGAGGTSAYEPPAPEPQTKQPEQPWKGTILGHVESLNNELAIQMTLGDSTATAKHYAGPDGAVYAVKKVGSGSGPTYHKTPEDAAQEVGKHLGGEEGTVVTAEPYKPPTPFPPLPSEPDIHKPPPILPGAAFNSHDSDASAPGHKAWVQGLSTDERSAIVYYTGSGYSTLNAILRGDQSATPTDTARIKALDSALDKAPPLKEDVVVRRTFNDPKLETRWPHLRPGKDSFTEPGYMSTTIRKSWLMNNYIRAEILLPAGTPGTYVAPLSGHTSEEELLLPRGWAFRVRYRGKNEGHKYIQLVAVPPEEV